MTDGLQRLGEVFLEAFTNPSSRTFWGGLIGMACVIVCPHLLNRPSARNLRQALVPWDLWTHRSTRLDLQMLVGKQTLRFLGFFPAVATSW